MTSSLALFDLDDTLLDRSDAFFRWVTSFLVSRNIPLAERPRMIAADRDGHAERAEFMDWIRVNLDINSSRDELLDEYFTNYPRMFRLSSPTKDALERLRATGCKIAIVTNGPPSQLRKIEVTGLDRLVDAICISEVLGIRKPDVGIFEHAARACGSDLSGWMIGDSGPADIAGGRASDLRTIWMSRGREWEETTFAPDHTVNTIIEAVEIILR